MHVFESLILKTIAPFAYEHPCCTAYVYESGNDDLLNVGTYSIVHWDWWLYMSCCSWLNIQRISTRIYLICQEYYLMTIYYEISGFQYVKKEGS